MLLDPRRWQFFPLVDHIALMSIYTLMFDWVSEQVGIAVASKADPAGRITMCRERFIKDGLDGSCSTHVTSRAAYKVQKMMAVVQLHAYNFESPAQLTQTLAATRTSQPDTIEIIGCLWLDEEILRRLPEICKEQLTLVRVHDCLSFDLSWVAKTPRTLLQSVPFGMDIDFSVPEESGTMTYLHSGYRAGALAGDPGGLTTKKAPRERPPRPT